MSCWSRLTKMPESPFGDRVGAIIYGQKPPMSSNAMLGEFIMYIAKLKGGGGGCLL